MDDLYTVVDNVEKDNSFEVIELIKENRFERTEKVRALNGKFYLRKYFLHQESFSQERLAAVSNLKHPNLPETYDSYALSDRSVIIQEFIVGDSLSDMINQNGPFESSKTAEIGIELCDAVECLHSQVPNPLIHRDIKPDNIIVTGDGIVKLVDFGAIREFRQDSNRDTVYVGTPGYASPEQFGFGQTDTRTDIYALGMTLNHLLTGRAPERGGESKNIQATGALSMIINKATAFDPEQRYDSVEKLKNDLLEVYKVFNGKPYINMRAADVSPSYNAKVSSTSPAGHLKADPSEPITKQRKMYPIHNNMAFNTKVGMLPVHLLIVAVLVYYAITDIIKPFEFGMQDHLLLVFQDINMAAMLYFYYVLGFNLFNINKWRFLSVNRKSRKITLCVVAFFVGAIIYGILGEFHTEAFNAVYSADS